ncbi:MAG: carboxypeptidase regulatory-like domain-containing protein [Deltaproteobacteria bacterium]|nr:carboxypeptidase regulatory-like domain-containing protein [Deltaproteobacteria bacterium]
MKRTNLLAILALVAGAQVSTAAATGGVEGTLVESSTGKIAANGSVTVTCGAVKKSGRADANGRFVINGLPPGQCSLTAAGGDFVTVTLGVTVSEGSISTLLVSVTSRAVAAQQRRDEERARRDAEKYRKERMKYRSKRMQMDFAADADGGGGGGGWGEAAGANMPRPAPPRMAPPRPAAPAAQKPAERAQPRGGAVNVNATAVRGPMPGNGTTPVMPVQKVLREDDAKRKEIAAKNWKADKQIANRRAAQQDNGWAVVRVFPVPEYSKNYDGPRTDFRETLYWNPTVETNARGEAEVTFVASDAVTSFRATAEGFSAAGLPGGGEATIQSRLPLTLDAKLPVEVTSGDTVNLPITIANETDEPLEATLDTKFGTAFKLASNPLNGKVKIKAKDKTTVVFALEVVATDGSADVEMRIASRGLMDEVKKTIRVVPKGFPIEVAASGTAKKGETSKQIVELGGVMPGTMRASVTMYPSPVAAIASGMDGMIREPGGCFEQASSTNYPNIMILGYLDSTADGADPALIAKTKTVLDKGYKLLTGYESSEKGYEWFGQNPGHEALTAYGLMEFADMSKVYDVDKKMVDRTADWLMSRRDGQGGFQRNARALDSFGRASPTTTNAYIMWALSEAKRTGGMSAELAMQKKLGTETKDPYLLALAVNTNLAAAPKAPDTTAMAKRLAALQAKDGSFPGSKETITMSGGESLTIESTSLAVLALLRASPNGEYESQIRSGVEWLNTKRGGYGAWGNTQATVLGLKALTAYAEHSRQMQTAGSATLVINGKDAGTIKFDKGRRDPLVWKGLESKLGAGKNTVEVRLEGAAALPYTVSIDYRSAQPATAPRAKVSVQTQLLAQKVKMGEGITLRARVENKTAEGIPMTLARIGLPGGTVFQTWQLKELRDKGLIDFYETRPREVILYWRALPPNAKKDVDINLLAAVPGTYEGPASSTYLYYTAEDKAWARPVGLTIER